MTPDTIDADVAALVRYINEDLITVFSDFDSELSGGASFAIASAMRNARHKAIDDCAAVIRSAGQSGLAADLLKLKG